jgi:hypothetical protein
LSLRCWICPPLKSAQPRWSSPIPTVWSISANRLGRQASASPSVPERPSCAAGENEPSPTWAELNGQAYTIAQSNLYAAFCWGRWQQLSLLSPESQTVLVADVIEDGRTSGVCVALADIARSTGDPLWDTWFPPNHPNCRTLVYPVSIEDAQAASTTEVDGTRPLPSPSYRRNLGTGPLADIVPVGTDDPPWARRHLAARSAISNHSA